MYQPTDLLAAARTAALFASDLSASSPLSCAEVDEAIRRAVRAHGGSRGCSVEVAGAYGEHPETAVLRMRWAQHVVEAMYSRSRGDRHGSAGSGSSFLQDEDCAGVARDPHLSGHLVAGDTDRMRAGLHGLEHPHVCRVDLGDGAGLVVDHVESR